MDARERTACLLVAEIPILLDLFDDSEDENDNGLEEYVWYAINRHLRNPVTRIQNYVEEVIPTYSDEIFRSHFRMKRTTFGFILNIIRPALLRDTAGQETISPVKQLLIAIWRMATPDSYRSICEKFDVPASTALKSVRKVVRALCNVSSQFIKWPEDDKVDEIAMGFASGSGFPRIIGAVDGTHINIKAPHRNPESYINRKGRHSIQLQAVCDHQLKFTHCYTGHAGSVHDQRIFRLSEVFGYLGDPTKFPNGTHLVGDAAYSIHENLLTPYRDNGHLTLRQRNYNFVHASARISIERAFGLLKGRFRSLLTVLDMTRVDVIPEYILACCILHNICLLNNDTMINDIETTDIPADQSRPNVDNAERRSRRIAGCAKRDAICNILPLRCT